MKGTGVYEVGVYFPARLAKVLREKGLTHEKIERDTGISRRTITRWLNGLVYPSAINLQTFCDRYGLDIDELGRKKGEPTLFSEEDE